MLPASKAREYELLGIDKPRIGVLSVTAVATKLPPCVPKVTGVAEAREGERFASGGAHAAKATAGF